MRRSTTIRALALAGPVLVALVLLGVTAGCATQGVGAESSPASQDLETTTTTTTPPTTASTTTTSTIPPEELLPPDSGLGKRVVFSISGQRMWWVDEHEALLRTALVSGRESTPEVGTFSVYSKTLNATGLDGSKMDYFVRFTKGPNGWAIGFHDIPEIDGVPVQTVEELGRPMSHGCIRQKEEDAVFTWEFLDVGSTVVVVA